MINRLVAFLQGLVGTDTIDEIIFDRLLPHEKIVMIDGPAEIAFLFEQKRSIVLLIGSLVVAFFSTSVIWTMAALGLAVTAIGLFVVGAVQLHYTRYVVTTNRIIYLKGVLKRTHQWIPWAKVTDLSMEQTIPDRIKNVGSVRIESANEDSQFRKMTNLTNPETMMRVLVYMVSQRQGSVPLPEDIHAILGVPGPDGITHLPRKDDEGGRGEEDDDVVSWGADDDGGGGDDENGGGGAGGDGSGGGGSSGGGSGGGAGGGDDTVLLTRPRRSPPVTVEGPLAPGTVTVPRPGRGEESRPSRANPVQDVGAPRRRRPEPPATGRGEGSSPADSIGPSDDGARPDTPPPDPGRAALDD